MIGQNIDQLLAEYNPKYLKLLPVPYFKQGSGYAFGVYCQDIDLET